MGRGIVTGLAALVALMASRVALAAPQAGPDSRDAALRIAWVTPAPMQPQQKDEATIFFDDFERPDAPGASYFEYGPEGESFVRRAGEGMGANSAAMRCQFEKGQVSAGNLKVLFGGNPFGKGIRAKESFREIYWRVYIKHESGWTGNPAKLGRATCLAAPNWSQGFIAHVWGGKGDALCIDPATGICDSLRVTDKYNDFAHLKWLGLRNGATPIFSAAESGRWVCVESHVRLNSPGRADGVFELWVDGKPEAARSDLNWHGDWSDYAINAIFLENYWNTGSVKRQARWFDNCIISTRPIGPIAAAQPVSLNIAPGHGAAWEAQVSTRPDEGAIVWTSGPAKSRTTSLRIDAARGAFIGGRLGKRDLAPETTHWVRVRQRSVAGSWSDWTDWHAPFRTTP